MGVTGYVQNLENKDKDPSEVILRKRDLKASQKGRVNIEKLIYEHEKKKVRWFE